jgi:RNA polymerase sigma factor (sigma-70 family)
MPRPPDRQENAVFTHPDLAAQLIRERRRQRLSPASQRPLAHQDSRPANAGPAGAETPAASVRRHEGTVTPMSDNLAVTALVMGAGNGDNQAWDALIDRYAPLIWSICRRYRLAGTDAEDVAQAVWLKLVDHLGQLRNPAALPGWLATTARRECGRVLRVEGTSRAWEPVLTIENIPDTQTATAEQELLAAERQAALREAFTRLPPACQRLLALLVEDPPLPYAEIGARLGMPAGSIGPNRGRCLDRLRRDPVIAALINAEALSAA